MIRMEHDFTHGVWGHAISYYQGSTMLGHGRGLQKGDAIRLGQHVFTVADRAVAAEALEWRAGYPGEVRENLDAAIRSDWAYLRRRFTPEYIESLLDREDAK